MNSLLKSRAFTDRVLEVGDFVLSGMEDVKNAHLVVSRNLVKDPIASIDSFPDIFTAVLWNDTPKPRMLRESFRWLATALAASGLSSLMK